jgi:3-methyl-2-oxobutanoate hydroxymethyltransferase
MGEERKKVTIRQLHRMKSEGRKIAALGVYDAPMAAIADRIGFEIMMIGNSGPMSLLGYRDSAKVRREDLLYMTQAVSRIVRYGLIVATMPYMSYLISKEEAIRTAAWLVSDGGAECVQCHADRNSAENVKAIVRAGVPVLAHIGLQSVRKTAQSGFSIQGKTAAAAVAIVDDALVLAEAGVFAFVLELVPAELAGYLRRTLAVPVLSLGSGPDADGVYQVSGDIVGFSVFPRPRTSAQFADARGTIEGALRKFFDDVRSRSFPPPSNQRNMPPAEYGRLMEMLRT